MYSNARRFTDTEIKEICEMYAAGEKGEVIARKFNTTASYISKIASKNNLPLRRRPKKNASGGAKVCPKCRKKIELKGAKFCPFCASDIRSDAEIAIEKLMSLRKMVMLLPENCRPEFEQGLTAAVKALEGKGNV